MIFFIFMQQTAAFRFQIFYLNFESQRQKIGKTNANRLGA